MMMILNVVDMWVVSVATLPTRLVVAVAVATFAIVVRPWLVALVPVPFANAPLQ